MDIRDLPPNQLPSSERLLFRRLTLADADAWMPFIESPEAVRFLNVPPGDRQACIAAIERAQRRYAEHGYGLWALIRKADGVLVGQAGLIVQEVDGQRWLEIGYHLLPAHWKQGYATEAARACRDFAFGHDLVELLISLIHVDNIPSQRVAERNGMRRGWQTMFREQPVHVYQLSRREWMQRHSARLGG
jgi:[ribosomal protein S5]-alanine N-acetyltransferase